MRNVVGSSVIAPFLLAASPAGAASTQGWDHASTAADAALISIAFGLPVVHGDWRGDLEAGASVGVAFGASELLKHLVRDPRPDGSDDRSAASAHTATAAAAAATLQKRYGWTVGIPAQIVAGFVGLARVKARKHAVDDVLIGAAIGEASGFALTSKYRPSVRVVPWGGHEGGGVALTAAW